MYKSHCGFCLLVPWGSLICEMISSLSDVTSVSDMEAEGRLRLDPPKKRARRYDLGSGRRAPYVAKLEGRFFNVRRIIRIITLVV